MWGGPASPRSRSPGVVRFTLRAMTWKALGQWWVEELADDGSYDLVLTPILLRMLEPQRGNLYLDLGAGEGRVMRAVRELGAEVVGLDINEGLARVAGASIVGDLPSVPVADASFDGVYALLVLEHVEDHRGVFQSAARVTRTGGVFALVINHPYWSSPGSTPIDDEDGVELWRPGAYFQPGHTDIPIRDQIVRFYHRSIGDLFTSAARAGWMLEEVEEHPHHDHTATIDIPRLLACRWRLLG